MCDQKVGGRGRPSREAVRRCQKGQGGEREAGGVMQEEFTQKGKDTSLVDHDRALGSDTGRGDRSYREGTQSLTFTGNDMDMVQIV